MTIRKNDDVVFSFNATLLDYAMSDKKIAWLRLQVKPGRIQHFFPDLYQDFSCSLGPWSPEQRDVRVTFTARVHLPIYKDGELVALTVVNAANRRFTVRFSNFADLLYTNLADEIERNAA